MHALGSNFVSLEATFSDPCFHLLHNYALVRMSMDGGYGHAQGWDCVA